jgi:hypothetical protein
MKIMAEKPQKPLATNSVNQELLKSIVDFGTNESHKNALLITELVKGENSSLIANFNPENHLIQLHQSTHE